MPASAYLLAGLFVAISLGAGALAWWTVGPRRAVALPLPMVVAFALLYLAGHRLGWQAGPTVELLGFELALPFDIALALVGGFAAAVIQRPLLMTARGAPGS
ncbi:MAG: hypothetical protein ABI534_01915 [Chloroflexota bacterium]